MLCIKRFEGDFAGAEIGLRVHCNGTGGCGLSSMLQPCPYGWQQGLTAGCQAVARSLAFGAACSYNTGSSARSLGKVWIPSRDGCVPPCKAHSGANCSSKHAHTPLANVPNDTMPVRRVPGEHSWPKQRWKRMSPCTISDIASWPRCKPGFERDQHGRKCLACATDGDGIAKCTLLDAFCLLQHGRFGYEHSVLAGPRSANASKLPSMKARRGASSRWHAQQLQPRLVYANSVRGARK